MTIAHSSQSRRSGLTIIEILVALTMTLIVLGAMMQAFQFASRQIQQGRGVMEMANRSRAAEELLRQDLASLTLEPRVYTESAEPNGYMEYIEGPRRDTSDITPGFNYLGDVDDIWAGTIRCEDRPFRGRFVTPADTVTLGGTTYPTIAANPENINPVVIESPLAEVVWWTDFTDRDSDGSVDYSESVVVFRRQLLIVPASVALPAFADFGRAASYLATNDISARIEPALDGGGATVGFRIVANSLKDLAHRQVRYGHNPVLGAAAGTAPAAAVWPHFMHRNTLWLTRSADYVAASDQETIDLPGTDSDFIIKPNGNDIMLTDVAGFDVKVYSPQAVVVVAGNQVVEPGDPGYVVAAGAAGADLRAIGAFVDLGHAGGGWFSGLPVNLRGATLNPLNYQFMFDYRTPRGQFGAPNIPAAWVGTNDLVFDTWTPFYEADGVDQDGDGLIDQGANGVHDDLGGVGTEAPDDDAERETRPPYPFPIRGLEISIRLIEKTTHQVHQTTIKQSFVPE